MARLKRAWMTYGIAMFLLQLVSLISDVAGAVSLLLFGLFIVGCGLGCVTLFKIVQRFSGLANIHFVTYRPEHPKESKAEKSLRQILGEDDVDEKSQVPSS